MDPAKGSDLLSTAWRMASPFLLSPPTPTFISYLAASRPPSPGALFAGWAWTDGTPSSNLACNTTGCSIFGGVEPKWVLPSFHPAQIRDPLLLYGGKGPVLGVHWCPIVWEGEGGRMGGLVYTYATLGRQRAHHGGGSGVGWGGGEEEDSTSIALFALTGCPDMCCARCACSLQRSK